MWQEWLDNYDTTEAALQAAVDAAQAAYDAAVAAEALAEADSDAADAAHAAAVAASDAADLALSDLEAEIAQLYAALQNAVANLALAQAIFDAGIGPVTTALTNAQNAVTAAELALGTPADMTQGTAWGDYNYWKGIFEADPTGVTWFDGTDTAANPWPAQTPLVGDHSDAIATSYVRVLTWQPAPSAPARRVPATWETTTVAELPTPVGLQVIVDYNARVFAGAEGISEAFSLDANRIYYLEVEADDVSIANGLLLNGAVAALGNEDIFDVAPELGDMPYGTGDAFANLWDAQLGLIVAQDNFDSFDDNLVAAQEVYEDWRDLYENQLALLDAAQQAVVDASLAASAAQDAEDAAIDAYNDAQTAVNDANALRLNQRDVVVPAAEQAIDDFLDTTEEDLMEWIADAEAQMAENDLYIAEYEIFMAEYQAEMDALQAEYDALMETPLNAAAFVEIESLWQEYFALGNEVDVIEDRIDILNSRIWIYQSWYDVPSIEDLQQVLADWIEDTEELVVEIALLEAQIATEEVNFESAQNRIALLEAQIETILARHANALAIAAKYKALMEAALAS
jgi:hypothetical protein